LIAISSRRTKVMITGVDQTAVGCSFYRIGTFLSSSVAWSSARKDGAGPFLWRGDEAVQE
jgi:hypothetical protein